MVTTHYMEEAEVLGDTICILANGVLKANGSPLELKRKLGSGYRLKLQANKKFVEKATMDIIKRYVPSARVLVGITHDFLIFCYSKVNSFNRIL